MPKVVFLSEIMTHYRVPFHEAVRELLARREVSYELVYGQPDSSARKKRDAGSLDWAQEATNVRPGALSGVVWQNAFSTARRSDLVVMPQENKFLLNYVLQMLPGRSRPLLSFFGHGRNFQSRNPNTPAERWKKIWATRCDWWFAYTEQTRDHLLSLGFPDERITVFNNSIDTALLRADLADVDPSSLSAKREQLGLSGRNVGVFIGGLYRDKRLDFLIDAADRVRQRVPDFELIIAGAGPMEDDLREMVGSRTWIKLLGPRFGRDKAELLALSKLFMMPGLVGLAILDAGSAGLPIVTTAFPWHSPEIAYLADGENGAMVEDWRSEDAYAAAVVDLLLDEDCRRRMSLRAHELSAGYTIQSMAERFANGVLSTLDAGPLK
jgi:glycosyltransferase involved in cell wall biosynthesis